MARTAGTRFVNAAALLPGGSAFAPPAGAAAGVAVADPAAVNGVAATGFGGVPAGAAAAGGVARPAMRWTSHTSGFVLRRMR